MKTSTAAVLIGVCAAVAAVAVAAQDRASSQVISSGGASAWERMADSQRLQRGSVLKPGEKIRATRTGDLTLQCPDVARVYICQKAECLAEACSDQQAPGMSVRDVGVRRTLVSLINREPKAPIIAAARAGGNPADAVLLLDERGLHASPALTRVLEGRYCLRFSTVPPTPPAVQTLSIDWDRAVDPEGLVAAPSLAPGLYALNKGTPGLGGACEIDADGTTAWVLAVPSSTHAPARAEWTTLAALVSDLEAAGAEPSTIVALRHGLLAALDTAGR